MQTHTPGPWFVDQQGAPTVRTSNGTVVCGVPASPSDAILIAAAPDLLDALKLARDYIGASLTRYPHAARDLAKVSDAIAKAEGRA